MTSTVSAAMPIGRATNRDPRIAVAAIERIVRELPRFKRHMADTRDDLLHLRHDRRDKGAADVEVWPKLAVDLR